MDVTDFINNDLCVDKLGISYEAINIWIFVIIEPIIFIIMISYIIHLRRKIKKLNKNE